jgi:hypothetical protein
MLQQQCSLLHRYHWAPMQAHTAAGPGNSASSSSSSSAQGAPQQHLFQHPHLAVAQQQQQQQNPEGMGAGDMAAATSPTQRTALSSRSGAKV